MSSVSDAHLDRSVFRIDTLDDETNDRKYWSARSPGERMEALELMRQIIYGYDPATTRLQRIFEIVELE